LPGKGLLSLIGRQQERGESENRRKRKVRPMWVVRICISRDGDFTDSKVNEIYRKALNP
jgi:hypothetical protein